MNAIYVCPAYFYGPNLWDLYGDKTVKMLCDLTRSTHNYFVDQMLSDVIPSLSILVFCKDFEKVLPRK